MSPYLILIKTEMDIFDMKKQRFTPKSHNKPVVEPSLRVVLLLLLNMFLWITQEILPESKLGGTEKEE